MPKKVLERREASEEEQEKTEESSWPVSARLWDSCFSCYSVVLAIVVATWWWWSKNSPAMTSLWGAWNESTPHTSSNLLNWYTPQGAGDIPYPCYNADKNWRGVTCLRHQFNETVWNTWVVGLELNDASIGGTLPPDIKRIDNLVSLTLGGNPNLVGSLPKELGELPLNILDLHDNGFSGTIPDLSNLNNLLQLDLSGNNFSGGFPTQFNNTATLQGFSIARNLLEGNVPLDAFVNMTQLLTVDLSGNQFTGPPPKFTLANSTLYNLNLSRNYFTGLPDLSQVFNDWLPKSLGVLDLSGLNIGGRLPVDWNSSSDLLSLEMLYLDNINISGILNIGSIQSVLNLTRSNNSTLKTLQVLSLRNNNITDVLFDKQFLKDGQIKFYLQENPYCNTKSKDLDGRRCFCEQYCAISEAQTKTVVNLKVIVIPTVICGVLLVALIFYLVISLHKKNKHVYALVKRFEESGVRAKRFEYNELRAATQNFAEERKVGQGGYGAVYKGILTDNTEIAVKQLFMKSQQATEDFLNEVLLITNLQHRNLVSLKGYCLHGKEMLLVYEFVDYCDLDKLLLQSSHAWQVVGWPARMRICLGVAQGLYYLHVSSQTKIIHRDIKASNILLDKNLNAKIADFGLARPIQESEIMTQQRAGTLGYTAPEYILYGQLSEKADVYSFGVLLLEIMSGTRNKDPTQPEDDIYLPTRAIKFHKEERLMEIMDSRLAVSESEALDVRRVLETAVMCVQSSPERRPTMFRVVTLLAGDAIDDSLSNVEDSSFWPEYQMPSESTTEDPLFLTPSSSTTKSGSTGPITNGNGSIELSTQSIGR